MKKLPADARNMNGPRTANENKGVENNPPPECYICFKNLLKKQKKPGDPMFHQ